MAQEPLRSYLEKRNINFPSPHTACWRGYTGSWEISDEKLWLKSIDAHAYYIGEYRSAPIIETDNALESVFSTRSPVFAEWFSGKLRIPLGETLQYVHMGYGSLYEKDLFIAVEKGIVVGEQTIDYRGEYNKLSEKKI